MLAVSCRARFAPNERSGLARAQGDQAAFERFMHGIISYYPNDDSLDFRIDDDAARYVDQVVGRNPVKVL